MTPAELHCEEDRLLDLVNGFLASRPRSEMLMHLRACPVCAVRFREIAGTHERAIARAEVRRGRWDERAPHPLFAVDRPRRGTLRLFAAALAAAAVLAVLALGVSTWRARVTSLPIREQVAWMPEPEASVFQRSAEDARIDPRLQEGLQAYRARDAVRAREFLGQADATGPWEQTRLVYLGSTLLQLGELDEALRTLQEVELTRVPEPWRSETQWSLAAAHAFRGDHARADSIRRLLASRPGEIGERARRAIDSPPAAR